MTDEGLKELAESKCLRSLFLSYTRVSDTGLSVLAKLERLQMLDLSRAVVSALDLFGTEVTDEGIIHLARLRRLRKLGTGRICADQLSG